MQSRTYSAARSSGSERPHTSGTLIQQPVVAMMFTPDSRETCSMRLILRPRSTVVQSTMLPPPFALNFLRAAMPSVTICSVGNVSG